MYKMIAYTVPEIEKKAGLMLVKDALTGNIKTGKSVKRLESCVSEYVGTRYAVSFSSGRSALYNIYKALDCEGKKVLLPSYTCIPALDGARWAGTKPFFVDVDLDTYNPLIARNVLKENISAFTLSYLYGLIGNISEALEIARDSSIPVVEDSAIALGGSFAGKKAGALGDAGMFSLQESKIITGWRGGVATTNRKDIYEKLIALRNEEKFTPSPKLLFNLVFSSKRRFFSQRYTYRYTMYGLKRLMTSDMMVGMLGNIMEFNPLESIDGWSPKDMPEHENGSLSNIQATVALESMKKINIIVKRRREMAKIFQDELSKIDSIHYPKDTKEAKHAYGRFPIRIEGKEKGIVRAKLLKAGIETSSNYPYICPYTAHIPSSSRCSYPNASVAARETLLLPFHTLLSDDDIIYIAESARKIR
ncbi:MAG: DegT/DnrJ/EryC1/StrS family aminotransferase [Candidatus Aenigmarchaeota archaeon]|nr:DegT/DnrJ/EryC1/StrS family aminotransferase [Candidatus Aenigmarchaeota archaeon]